jgi:hypothetical protein
LRDKHEYDIIGAVVVVVVNPVAVGIVIVAVDVVVGVVVDAIN